MFVHSYNHENIYLWADLHLNHDRPFIIEPRGFENIQTHNDAIKARIRKVPYGATLWLLGDTVFGYDAEASLEKFLEQVPATEIILMPGNHFSGFKQMKSRRGRQFTLADKEIRLVSNLEEMRVKDQGIVVSHYPIMSWNGAGKGAWMVHGHVHGRIPTSLPNRYDGGKILDVGIESCPEPVSIAEVRAIMEKKAFKQVDHHGNDTANSF